LGALWAAQTQASSIIEDSAPPHQIWESSKVLTTATRRNLESLLLQHHHLTGEKLFLVLISRNFRPKLAAKQAELTPDQLARQIFDDWNLETTSRGANALIAVREEESGRPEWGIHLGAGIIWPEDAPAKLDNPSTYEDSNDELSETLSGQQNWDRIAWSSAKWWLETMQSPVVPQLEKMDLARGPRRREPNASSPWFWVVVVLVISGTVFYWTYDQILGQEVLIGANRWILINPRMKFMLNFKLRSNRTRQALTLDQNESRQSPEALNPALIWRTTDGPDTHAGATHG
jgi:hypothetical protein